MTINLFRTSRSSKNRAGWKLWLNSGYFSISSTRRCSASPSLTMASKYS